MPVTVPDNLPAIELLKKENIFIIPRSMAESNDLNPLKVLILNLMPFKVETETDLIRLLSNNPLQIEVDFLMLSSHRSKNTPEEHIRAFYKKFDKVRGQKYDGFIVTGAPVELLNFEDVNYWEELKMIFDWAQEYVKSTFYICWAAQAALYHFHNVPKYELPEKMFGVFKHTVYDRSIPLFRGFDDEFYVPHSRMTEIKQEDIAGISGLEILSGSDEAGLYIIMGRGGREFYITGHSEYPLYRLHYEYTRDKKKGLPIAIPKRYYKEDDPDQKPVSLWTGHGNLLFNNWINYYLSRSGK